METGIGLRDGEENTYKVFPSFSKRGLYYQFCEERGWNVMLKRNSNAILIATHIEKFGEEERKPPIYFWPFFCKKHWKYHFPNLKIANRTADVCIKCHVFQNKMQFVR